MRLFPHATDPAAPINSGGRTDVVKGIAQGRFVETLEDVVVAYVIGVCMAAVSRAIDLPEDRLRVFAERLGAMLLHGLGAKRGKGKRIMREGGESILATGIEASV